jgi:heme/copper-type cytochrome/quinol oxidase subunit 2
MNRLLKTLLLLFIGLNAAAENKTNSTTDTVVKLECNHIFSGKNEPLDAEFGQRIVVFVSGPSADFEKAGAARIYINDVLMPYPVVYNCPCDSLGKYFTLTFTIGAHDASWNKWYGFGDDHLSVKLDVGTAEKVYSCSPDKKLRLLVYRNGALIFASVVVGLFLVFTILLVFVFNFDFIRDPVAADPKPFSLSRFQLLWWTVIVISCYILLFAIRDDFGLFSQSTLILIGISAAGTGFSVLVDYSVNDKPGQTPQAGKNFFLDILSDNNGINIHRYQNFIFTIVFGIVFVYKVFATANMPDFGTLELSLMGLSTATYVALKTNENKTTNTTSGDSSNQNIVG